MVQRQTLFYAVVVVAVSACGVALFHSVLRIVDNDQSIYEAKLRYNDWQHRLEKRTSQVQHVCDLLSESNRLSEGAFYEHLLPLAQDPAFHCAEWQPRVEGGAGRKAFLNPLRRELKNQHLEVVSPTGQPLPRNKVAYPIRYTTLKSRRQHLGWTTPPSEGWIKAQSGLGVFVSERFEEVSDVRTTPVHCEVSFKKQGGEREGILTVYFTDVFAPLSLDALQYPRTEVAAFRRSATESASALYSSTADVDFQQKKLMSRTIEHKQSLYDLEFVEAPAIEAKRAKLSLLGLFLGPIFVCSVARFKWQRRANLLAGKNMLLSEEVNEHLEIQRTLNSLLKLREQERRLVANEIHDGFIQEVVSAQMFLESLATRISDQVAKQELEHAQQLVELAAAEARRLVNELKPQAVDEYGFIPALQRLMSTHRERFGMSVALRFPPEFPQLEIQRQRSLYRIIQEALANVRRHSGVQEATVSLHVDQRYVVVEVLDQGCGFEMTEVQEGSFGLRGIRERAQLLGGEAIVQSLPGEGTALTVRLPRDPDDLAFRDPVQAAKPASR